ncbi:MAG: hypothetical protein HY801_13145, partial [Candidatus Lindowbacteria bacterium]|nr:hypothetical protein [Candidatus Lindowbacteria bacterium]
MIAVEHIGWRKQSVSHYLIAGAIAGLLFSFKENWGALALAALVCTRVLEELLISEQRPSAPARHMGKTALLIAALLPVFVLSLLILRGRYSFVNVVYFVLPSLIIAGLGGRLVVARFRESRRVLDIFLPMICLFWGFVCVVIPWVVYFMARLGPQGFYDALIRPLIILVAQWYYPIPTPSIEGVILIVLALVQGIMLLRERTSFFHKWAFLGILWAFGAYLTYEMFVLVGKGLLGTTAGRYAPYSDRGFEIICYGPLAVHLGMAFLIAKDFRNLKTVDKNRLHLSASLWIYSIATIHIMYPVSHIYHFMWGLTPAIMLGGYFIFRSLKFWESDRNAVPAPWQKPLRTFSFLAFPVYFTLFLALPIVDYFIDISASPFRIRISQFSDISGRRGGIFMAKSRASDLSAVIDFIGSHTRPGDYIFDMTGSFFYFLTDRRNPTGWESLYGGVLYLEDVGEIRRRLD